MQNETTNTFLNVISRIRTEMTRYIELDQRGLLERVELHDFKIRAKQGIQLVIDQTDDETQRRFKKMMSGVTNMPKPGFTNPGEAERDLRDIKDFIDEGEGRSDIKTIKNRFKHEGIFVESRTKGDDLHLIIGKRDGIAEKAHAVIDSKTGEIRVEDNQMEPLDIVRKIESILTLPGGRRIRITRESIEELVDSTETKSIEQKMADISKDYI